MFLKPYIIFLLLALTYIIAMLIAFNVKAQEISPKLLASVEYCENEVNTKYTAGIITGCIYGGVAFIGGGYSILPGCIVGSITNFSFVKHEDKDINFTKCLINKRKTLG